MDRTSQRYVRRPTHRRARTGFRGNNEVPRMARRPRDGLLMFTPLQREEELEMASQPRVSQPPNIPLAFFVAVTFLICLTIVGGLNRGIHHLRKEMAERAERVEQAGARVVLPAALPTQAPPAKPDLVNILLLGSDQRGDDRSYRTDVIVLVSIDRANGVASAVSFPRDLWVEPPTLYPMKINMIHAMGGFEALAEMFRTNFGVEVDYYVMTNFSGFTNVIDSMGGIDVHIHTPLKDSCDLPQAQGGICAVDEGVLPMDGPTALWYARSRASTSDYDRLRRAQEVVEAVFVRLMSLEALTQLPKFYQELSQNLETNMGLGEITPLVPVAVSLFQEPDRIKGYVIDQNQATETWSWDGMWILLPDPGAIESLLAEAGIQ